MSNTIKHQSINI